MLLVGVGTEKLGERRTSRSIRRAVTPLTIRDLLTPLPSQPVNFKMSVRKTSFPTYLKVMCLAFVKCGSY